MARILYVDDDDDIREVAVMALELDGELEVRACGSGKEAIAFAPGWQPDLILLDVMMPEMDGPSTLAELRRLPETAATRVVFITARTQSHEVERFVALGAVGVIAKPFDPLALARQVREYMAR